MSDAPVIVEITAVEASSLFVDVIMPPLAATVVDAVALAGPPGPPGVTGPPGPAGPVGPSAVSTDPANFAILGSDQLIWVPQALPLTGGELTGPLGLPNGSLAAPSLAFGALDGTGIARSGAALTFGVQGTMTLGMFAGTAQFYGPLLMLSNPIRMVADPTGPQDAATKAYADTKLPLTGGAVNGNLSVSGNLTSALNLVSTGAGVPAQNVFAIGGAQLASFQCNPDGSVSYDQWDSTGGYQGRNLQMLQGGPVQITSNNKSDPLYIYVQGGLHNRVQLNVLGAKQWSVGPFSDGHFAITNETDGLQALTIQPNGATTLNGPLTTGGNGITYANMTGGWVNHAVSFGWNGSQLGAFVDNVFIDALAMQGSIGSYLPISGGTLTGGLSFGSVTATTPGDLTKHLLLYNPGFGISVSSARLNLVAGSGTIGLVIGGADRLTVTSSASALTVPLTVAGSVTVGPTGVTSLAVGGNAAASTSLTLNAATGQTRQVQWQTAGVLHWNMFISGTESGSNAGGDFSFNRYDDTGVGMGLAFGITRSTGAVTIPGSAGIGTTGTAPVLNVGSGAAATTSVALNINGAVATNRVLTWQTAGSSRWGFWVGAGPESGGNVGSPISLVRYSDAGANLGSVFSITRDTGLFTLTGPLSVGGALTQTGAATLAGGLNFGSAVAASTSDLTLHLSIYGGATGIGINASSGARMNYVSPAGWSQFWVAAGNDIASLNGSGMTIYGNMAVGVAGGSPSFTVGNNTATTANIYMNAVQGSNSRNIFFMTGGVSRWVTRAVNAEGGTNSGSNYDIARFDDTGTNLGSALTIVRSTGGVTIPGTMILSSTVTIGGTLTVNANANFGPSGAVNTFCSYGNATTPNLQLNLNGAAGVNRGLMWMTATSSRWQIIVNGAESGSNAGGTLQFIRYDDTGANIGNALTLTRSNGNVVIGGAVGFNGVAAPARPAITGSRGGNAALASLITALASTGLITDSTTA